MEELQINASEQTKASSSDNKKADVIQLPKKEYSLAQGLAVLKTLSNAQFQAVMMCANLFVEKETGSKPADIIAMRRRK